MTSNTNCILWKLKQVKGIANWILPCVLCAVFMRMAIDSFDRIQILCDADAHIVYKNQHANAFGRNLN